MLHNVDSGIAWDPMNRHESGLPIECILGQYRSVG